MSTYTDLVEGFKRMGMTEAQAKSAAAGRDGVPDKPEGVSELEFAFRNAGLSEAAAKYAAEGRGGSVDLTTPARQSSASGAQLTEAEAAALLSRAELLVAAGRAAVAGGQTVDLNERGTR